MGPPSLSVQKKNGKCAKKDKCHWTVRGPTQGLGAADKRMMVTILGLWPQGHNPRMVTIIPLSPGSTQPAVHTIRTRLGGPYSRSFPKEWNFPLEFTIG